MREIIYAGIDSGSISAEVVLVAEDGTVLAKYLLPTGRDGREAGNSALAAALLLSGHEPANLRRIISTGYSRKRIEQAHGDRTEIACHTRGITTLLPGTRTLIDIGGQDSKAIAIDEAGRVADFAMNDKCAAGTGRFLEVMAQALGTDVAALGPLALSGPGKITLSNTCTVFAESEVVSLIAQGTPANEIANALCRAVASRVAGLAARVGLTQPVAMSGGVALNQGVVAALAARLKAPIQVAPDPAYVGALGAALIARDEDLKTSK